MTWAPILFPRHLFTNSETIGKLRILWSDFRNKKKAGYFDQQWSSRSPTRKRVCTHRQVPLNCLYSIYQDNRLYLDAYKESQIFYGMEKNRERVYRVKTWVWIQSFKCCLDEFAAMSFVSYERRAAYLFTRPGRSSASRTSPGSPSCCPTGGTGISVNAAQQMIKHH